MIDFHTHIFPDAIAKKAIDTLDKSCNYIYKRVADGTLDGLKSYMRTSNVRKSVVLPIVTKESQYKSTNMWAKSIIDHEIEAFGSIYPNSQNVFEQIDFVCDLQLKGIKLHCQYQNFVIDEPKMYKIYEYCFKRNLIIVQHAGFDPAFSPPFSSTPQKFAKIADDLQGGIMIAAHLGGHDQWQDVLDVLAGKNIYLDTSMGFEFFPITLFEKIVKKHGADKILFATDSPWSDAKQEIQSLKNTNLTSEQKQLILTKNAEKLLEN